MTGNNPNTRIVVFGYAGDAHQVKMLMPYYLHHGCPVTVFSPEDAPIEPWCEDEDVEFRVGGKKCYIGADAIARQEIHMRMMLEYPEQFFFACDADSLCLDPLLPAYLYRESEVLWSNEIPDLMHERPPGYKLPRIALHPPWFFSRAVIERLLYWSEATTPDPVTPVIDHWLLQCACLSRVPHKDFHNGSCSFPTENDEFHFGVMSGKVRYGGTVFVHTVKSNRVLNRLREDRQFYLRNRE
jgi:hypothetical protein